VSDKKTSELDFDGVGKTSIPDRLRKLIGERSVRQAAADWGLSFSTLNNYLTRGTEPSLNVAIKIANVERVTVEWLATGRETSAIPASAVGTAPSAIEHGEYLWRAVYDSLRSDEREALIKLIHRKGVEGILSMGGGVLGHEGIQQTLTPQMKQIIELIETCDDAQLKEILQDVADLKSATLPGAESVSQVSKKVS
jgi:transcriptional regulator with XRE-family HTH domain